jgi:hypothetical protein
MKQLRKKRTSVESHTIIIAAATDFSGGNASAESLIARRATRAATRLVFFEARRLIFSRASVRQAWGEGRYPSTYTWNYQTKSLAQFGICGKGLLYSFS